MKLNPVLSSDALKLSRLAKEIYREFYLHLWKPGGADWYMHDYAYHPDQLLHEINQPNNLHFFVLNDANELMGYLKLITQTSYPNNPFEIERIYLHKRFTGKGIGNALMQRIEEIATQYQKKSILLKAMDTCSPVIEFYMKNGFQKIGQFDLDYELIKPEFKGMLIMQKELKTV